MSKPKTKSAPFVMSYTATMDSPAWRALPHGARSLYLAMKRRYNRTKQGAVYLSARAAAKELGSSKNYITGWTRTLQYHGFIVQIEPACLGVVGKGKSALYRLTDEPYQHEPPTRDFVGWDGARWDDHQKQNPVPQKGDRVSHKKGTLVSHKKGTVAKNGVRQKPNNGGFPQKQGVPQTGDISRYSCHLSGGGGAGEGRRMSKRPRVRDDIESQSGRPVPKQIDVRVWLTIAVIVGLLIWLM